MMHTFQGKNGKVYSVNSLTVSNIVNIDDLMLNYSMKELDELYTKYFGSYILEYKYILTLKIKRYDCSEYVNSFIFRGNSYWLDKATRVGLMHLANCSNDTLLVVLGDEVLTFLVEFVKDFLSKLEIYASLCYIQTQQHLVNVKALSNKEDILNYDYTTGYPEKIVLE